MMAFLKLLARNRLALGGADRHGAGRVAGADHAAVCRWPIRM